MSAEFFVREGPKNLSCIFANLLNCVALPKDNWVFKSAAALLGLFLLYNRLLPFIPPLLGSVTAEGHHYDHGLALPCVLDKHSSTKKHLLQLWLTFSSLNPYIFLCDYFPCYLLILLLLSI